MTNKDVTSSITLKDVEVAYGRIKHVIKKTEIDHSSFLSKLMGTEIYLKFENTQKTGSFKIRGATNKINSLSESEKKKGVVASSAGNHAQGVALAASKLGVKSKIVMPINAPLIKVMATKNYGAEVVLHGNIYDEAFERAKIIEQEEGRIFVHAYDDPLVIAGQGTIALEILEQLPDVDSVIIPIGGGGLISGIATVLKTLKPSCKIYGVQADGAKSMAVSFRDKKITKLPHCSTIADGIAVKSVSENIFKNYICKYVDEIVTVSEDEIAEGIVYYMERAKTVVEGAAGTTFAAAQKLKGKLGKKCLLLLCGGNIDLNMISKVIERGLMKHGRLKQVRVAVEDSPGKLSALTKIIADKRANIIEVKHDRAIEGLYLRETAIEFLLETSGFEQIQEIETAFGRIARVLKTETARE